MNIHPKVLNATLGGAATILIVWALKQFFHYDVPSEVASSATTVVAAALGYMTPSPTT